MTHAPSADRARRGILVSLGNAWFGRRGTRVATGAEDVMIRLGDRTYRRAERRAERTLATLRGLNFAALLAIFSASGALEMDAGLSFPLAGYGVVTAISVVLILARYHRPWLPWALATLDVAFLLHCQGMLAAVPGWTLDTALLAPGAVMINLILVTTAVRHNPWLVAYTAALYAGGWISIWAGANLETIASGASVGTLFQDMLRQGTQLAVVALVAFTLFVSVRHARHHLLRSLAEGELRRELARFVAPNVVRSIARNGSSEALVALRDVAVFMVDIRGFTALTERMRPMDVLDLLNDFRAVVERTVAEHGGMIDKFIGDAALVVFGAERQDPQAASNGLAWACQFGRDLDVLNTGARREWVEIALGGHWGPVVAGVVGKGERREFTVLGDTVNACARIQQLASAGDLPLVVSEDLVRAAGGEPADGSWRELPETSLRGRRAGIRLFAGNVSLSASSEH